MLWIETPSFKNVFHNELTDDFIRFLPKSIGCEKSDLEVWVFTGSVKQELKSEMKSDENVVKVMERQDDTLTITACLKKNIDGEDLLEPQYSKSFLMQKATRSWPYEEKDGKLNFIGLM